MGEIIISTVALYGISTLISDYPGPFSILSKIKSKLSVARCNICLSVWFGVPIAYYTEIGTIGYLAIIGGVIALDRIIG